MCKLFKNFLLSIALLVFVNSANAGLIQGQNLIVAEDGGVYVDYLGYEASYSNDLYLYVEGGDDLFILNNKAEDPNGANIYLGEFSAGDTLLFYIHVTNTNDTFFSGSDTSMNDDGSGNSDNFMHTMVDVDFGVNSVYVGFEDLFGGGDKDFDDVEYAFINVGVVDQQSEVPEPSIMLIIALSLLGISLKRKYS